jgi:fumarate hydratase subunit alpha
VREVVVSKITKAVRGLFIDANCNLSEDVTAALHDAVEREESAIGKEVLEKLLENARIAKEEGMPICQDTGLPVVFIELGQDVHLTGGELIEAVNEGVRQGSRDGYLRPSVCHCLSRQNTGANTPAVIHVEIVSGAKVRIVVLPKGGGSENASTVAMLPPAAGPAGIKGYVVQRVKDAGASPCPPVIVGVGIGGTIEQAALIAKKALLRPVGSTNPDPEIAALEADLLDAVNDLGIGPQGYGGRVTALAIHVQMIPCHIASLPLAVNIQCYAHRHKERII